MEKVFIGIAGGIGAGKSVVSRILRLKGYGVYDCDFEASQIMNSPEVLDALSSRFGEGLVTAEGVLNRPMLASIIFSDETQRLWVNALVHSRVKTDLIRWAAESDRNCFVESAILAESGIADMCGAVWLVQAAEQIRENRAFVRKLQTTSGMIDEEAIRADIRRRIASQRKEEEKLIHSGLPVRRIDNSGIQPVLPRIDALLQQLHL